MSEIYVIYHDIPNTDEEPEFTETLGYCMSVGEAQKVTKELRKKRHPKNALFPYAPVYAGRVYFGILKELKGKVK